MEPNAPRVARQIQLVIYCLMLGCDAGDLVQCVRDAPDAPITISRVELGAERDAAEHGGGGGGGGSGGGRMGHARAWREFVAPRLYAAARAVLALRADDALRWRWLLSTVDERLAIAAELCPHLDDNEAVRAACARERAREQAEGIPGDVDSSFPASLASSSDDTRAGRVVSNQVAAL